MVNDVSKYSLVFTELAVCQSCKTKLVLIPIFDKPDVSGSFISADEILLSALFALLGYVAPRLLKWFHPAITAAEA